MAVLVVDDSRAVRAIMCDTLKEHGFTTIEACDGTEAVTLAEAHKPELITMDVQMPHMDGFEACARIRATEVGSLVPIVFVTSKDTLADREKGFAMGASVFISKNVPACWHDVARVVTRILRPGEFLDGFTVLVVQPDSLIRADLSHCLAQQDGRILAASQGDEALHLVRQHLGEIDMVITDYCIPDIGNADFVGALRARFGFYNLPIIVLTSLDHRERVLEIFEAGATDCIFKPFVREEFLARVRGHVEARHLVKELSDSVVELERLNKLRDEFLAVSSHDLKSPLTSIMGYAELLSCQEPQDDLHTRALSSIITSVRFMLEIINDVVELNKNQLQETDDVFRPLDLGRILSLAISGHSSAAQDKDIVIDQLFDEEQVIIHGDRNKFMRILNNLLSNAIKFTPSGGRVELGLGRYEERAVVTVSDTGIGIADDVMPTLFDRYTKASRQGTGGEPGTGLGMSITRQLVDMHDGDLEVESIPDQGTCFRLSFPLMQV